MNRNYKMSFVALAGLVLAGCADTDINYIMVDKPQSIADLEYLDAYGALKDYIDRSEHPLFRLGAGVSAQDYVDGKLAFRVTNANFDMMTAGNAMKYASIVADDGSMNFSLVEKFVDAAKNSGMEIYGHTLCWHEQQNVKWLNSLIADKEMEVDPDKKDEVVDAKKDYKSDSKFPFYVMGYEPQIIDGILTVPEYPGGWYQFFVMDGLSFEEGQSYRVTARMKGSVEGDLNVQLGDWGKLKEKKMSIPSEWDEVSIDMDPQEVTSGFCVFQPGTYEGKLEIEWVQISHLQTPVMEIGVPLLANGDAANGESSNIVCRTPDSGDNPAKVVDDPDGTGKVYASSYNSSPTEAWDSQLFITSDTPLEAGTKIHVKFRYKATDARNIETQAHGKPGDYHYWQFIGTLNATTEWQEHEWTGTISADQAGNDGCSSIAFNLSSAQSAGTFYIDDVVFEKLVSSNTIPLTPEEKNSILTDEMERWVKGMMEATAGQVKAWDVVNEAISGGPWGQRYDLQHAATSDNPSNKFYWQDYLGDDFARVPIKFARKYFQENGGNPDELKLFVNDYNLESDWDDNQKLKSLISWIEQWESDGETKIDGIGSQMHVNYYLNPTTQKSKEEHIEKMLRLMAGTGKLVRITELDMGLVDENGNSIKTEDATLEQQKLMAEHYKWIISKYFEIVPQNQQFGICQWAQTDSPEGSGWREGEPIGLWNLNYQRKPQYGGFAEGLKGNGATPVQSPAQ